MIFTGDPYDLSAPAASSVVPMLSELASLSADLGVIHVSYLLDRWFVSALWLPFQMRFPVISGNFFQSPQFLINSRVIMEEVSAS